MRKYSRFTNTTHSTSTSRSYPVRITMGSVAEKSRLTTLIWKYVSTLTHRMESVWE